MMKEGSPFAHWLHISCLLCGNSDSEVVFPGRWETGLGGGFGRYFSSSRLRAVYGPIVRCTHCGFVYANPQPPPSELERVYRRLVDNAYADEEPARTRTAERMLALVERHCPKKGSLLDVGCSIGIFLRCAQRNGWQVLGVEPSSWAIEQCQMRGIPVLQGFIETITLSSESFDVVTMWDVLEHTLNPVQALKKVHDALKPDGFLFINVPNIESVAARLLRHRWPLLLVEHLWYFSPSTLKSLLERNGFRLLAIVPHWITFSLKFVLFRLIQQGILPASLQRWVESAALLRRVFITFTMGEMTAVAKKEGIS